MAFDAAQWKPELHPRDRKGRFRDKWGLSKPAQARIDRILGIFNPFGGATFRSDAHIASFLNIEQKKQRKRKPWSTRQQASLDYYTTDGFDDIDSSLRAGHEDSPQVRDLDSMMEPLPQDMVLTRVVGPEAFGLPPERMQEVEEWTGKLATDKSYQSMNAGNPLPTQGPRVTMSIVAPKGTRAVIVGDGSREVLLDREVPFRITHVDDDGRGGMIVRAVVEGSGTGEAPRALGKELSPQEIAPAEEATPEAMQRRGLGPDGKPAPQQAPAPAPAQQQPEQAPTPAPQAPAAPAAPAPDAGEQERAKATQDRKDEAARIQMLDRTLTAIADGGELGSIKGAIDRYISGQDNQDGLPELRSAVKAAKTESDVQDAVDTYMRTHGLFRTGANRGSISKFNPDTMDPLSSNTGPGNDVRILRQGIVRRDADGNEVVLRKPLVTRVGPSGGPRRDRGDAPQAPAARPDVQRPAAQRQESAEQRAARIASRQQLPSDMDEQDLADQVTTRRDQTGRVG